MPDTRGIAQKAGAREPNGQSSVTTLRVHRIPQDADSVDLDLDDVTGAQRPFRVAGPPDPGRRARQDEVARFERERRRDVGDEKRDREDQVVRVAVLEHLAVQFLNDAQPAPVAELGDGDALGADGAERVEALGARPLALGVLDVSRRQVVGAPVTAHVVEGVALGDPPAAGPDLDAQLGFRVHVRRLGRKHDRLARPDQCVLELAEEERRCGRVVAELGGVLGVVASDADDLHGPILTRSLI